MLGYLSICLRNCAVFKLIDEFPIARKDKVHADLLSGSLINDWNIAKLPNHQKHLDIIFSVKASTNFYENSSRPYSDGGTFRTEVDGHFGR